MYDPLLCQRSSVIQEINGIIKEINHLGITTVYLEELPTKNDISLGRLCQISRNYSRLALALRRLMYEQELCGIEMHSSRHKTDETVS